ncbi:hypothetical protein AVEN_214785-1 [Araneus ventricosus]|uniref:Uncharacterized protein n=1 Tax=Araneus ventricosus TaxID=182803 RepID=A0A4Y2UB41_ARAVE|nr:hypothetical protein AVEN_214785-1 [Araneus ventricosus]
MTCISAFEYETESLCPVCVCKSTARVRSASPAPCCDGHRPVLRLRVHCVRMRSPPWAIALCVCKSLPQLDRKSPAPCCRLPKSLPNQSAVRLQVPAPC